VWRLGRLSGNRWVNMRSTGFRRIGRYLLVASLVLLLTALYTGRRNLFGRFIEHQRQQERVDAARRQTEDLRKEIDSSGRRVENLGNDPIEIEAAIRRSKDLVREGEKIYRIEVDPDKAAPAGGGNSGRAAP
jgi:cell division protein FtsB